MSQLRYEIRPMARAGKDDKLMHTQVHESLELLCLGVLNLWVQVSDFLKFRNILDIMYYQVYMLYRSLGESSGGGAACCLSYATMPPIGTVCTSY